MKIFLSIIIIFSSNLLYAQEFTLLCEISKSLNNKNLSSRFSKKVSLKNKTVENISGNYFDRLIIFNERELIMHNYIYETSSSFSFYNNVWTSYNKEYIDVYKCKKRRH
tara:strand:+ start:209 stop:535 length:327 start_codon:yes stop_codon:yes gene_type:complete